MSTQRTWKDAYTEVKEDLDRAVARNNELADQLDAANTRIAELETQLQASPEESVRELTEARRQRDYWRERAQTLEGVVEPIVGRTLPRRQDRLVQRLGEVFINRANVEAHLQSSQQAPATESANGENEEEEGGDEEGSDALNRLLNSIGAGSGPDPPP